jgi:hypothetical protein
LIPCQLWKKQTPSGHSSNNKDKEKRKRTKAEHKKNNKAKYRQESLYILIFTRHSSRKDTLRKIQGPSCSTPYFTNSLTDTGFLDEAWLIPRGTFDGTSSRQAEFYYREKQRSLNMNMGLSLDFPLFISVHESSTD